MNTTSPFGRARLAIMTMLAAIALHGCSPMTAQNPPGSLQPVNAVADTSDDRVILNGADVVAYFTQGRHIQGNPEIRSRYENVTFRFSSPQNKALFEVDPRRYLPQFGGYCANGIAYGIPWGGSADTWSIIDGKLYIFGGKASQEAFELDVPGNLRLAERYWASEVKGSNSFLQRARRLVFRVPHYKSGEELAQAVAAARATKK